MAGDEEPIDVLCVDDDPDFVDIVAAQLRRADDAFSVTSRVGAAPALAYLEETEVDCIVSDYDMPDIDGLEFLQAVRAERPELPFLLFTGNGSESLVSDAVSAGVTDYMQKGGGTEQYRVLARRIRTAVERVRARSAVERTQARIEALFDAAPDAIMVSVDGTVAYANPEAAGLLGAAAADALVGEPVETFLGPASAESAIFEAVRDGRTAATTQRRLATADGGTVVASATYCNITWEGSDAVVAILQAADEDRRDRNLAALHEASRKLMAAENRETVAGIGVVAASEILGLDANAVHLVDDTGGLAPVAATAELRAIVDDLPTFQGEGSIAWRVYEGGEVTAVPDVREDPDLYNRETAVRSELYLPLGDHGVLIAASTIPGAFDQQDTAVGRVLAANMEAALEAVEQDEQLRERERELEARNDRLEQFASVVSHDLRNPLNVATGRLELLREADDSEHAAAIERALDRMEALIDDLLTLARAGETITETESVSLATAAEAAWETVETADAALVVGTDRTIRADASRLQQLLENLFRNAVEHAGPDVTVTVGDRDGGFYVADDGPGIPADERDRVFEDGYSTDDDGTGFGLAIVESIAEAHGWTVSLDGSADGGARFVFTGVEDA